VDPPPHILWALQLGQDEIVKSTLTTKNCISFDFTVEVVEDSSSAGFRLRGPAVQGVLANASYICASAPMPVR
jgi:hypothetical protein